VQVVEAARLRATGNGVVIAFADYNYRDVLMNWLVAMATQGIENYLVIALDTQLHALLVERRIPVVLSELSGDLRALWIRRIEIFASLCAAGVDFIHSDVDAVWLRDPEPFLQELQADLIVSQGTVWPPDVHRQFGFVVCCGFFKLRSTAVSRRLLAGLAQDVVRTGDDQVSLNRLLAGQSTRWEFDPADAYYIDGNGMRFLCSRSVMRGVDANGLRTAVLPHHLFQRIGVSMDEAPYVRHLLSAKNPAAKLQEFANSGCLFLRPDWQQIDFDTTTLLRLRNV
jgi:hypothetical protein